MRCSKAHRLLSAYLDGELPARERAGLESHLKQCGVCGQELHGLQEIKRLFALAEPCPAPTGFSRRLMARLDEAAAQRFSLAPLFLRFAETVMVLLIIGLGMMSGSFLTANSGLPSAVNGASLLALDVFDPAPPGSLSGAYLAMLEADDEK